MTTHFIDIETNRREEMIEISDRIRPLLDSCISGICNAFVAHTTCGMTINENADPDVQHDMLLFLRELVPQDYTGFRHFEHNSDSHIKSSLLGSSVTFPVKDGRPLLGRWQGIYLCEFDGPRNRTVAVSVIEG
ncbi:MAG: secondary thiamine-phosphate synthase enzyme YjbQ [Pyrinomonadaceae bacterium]